MTLNCSHDKLAFRLRLAGGAVRSCQGAPDCLDTLVLPLVLSVVSNSALVGHTEKPVRKATCKLAKELLKGLTSFYPKGIRPLCVPGSGSGEGGLLQLGTPTSLENVQSGWYVLLPQTRTLMMKKTVNLLPSFPHPSISPHFTSFPFLSSSFLFLDLLFPSLLFSSFLSSSLPGMSPPPMPSLQEQKCSVPLCYNPCKPWYHC